MTICGRYCDTSIFTSQRDGLKILGFLVSLGPDFWTFRTSKNFVFQDQEISSKNRQKIINKKIAGLHTASSPYVAAPLPPTKVGAKYLAAVVLTHHDCVLSPKRRLRNLVLEKSFLSWSWGQLPPQRKTFPTTLLGLLEKRSKIWRYGRSWNQIYKYLFRKMIENWTLLPA